MQEIFSKLRVLWQCFVLKSLSTITANRLHSLCGGTDAQDLGLQPYLLSSPA